MPIESFAEDIRHDHAEATEAADQLLREIVTDDRQPNYSELVFFKQRLGWNEGQVTEQRRRIYNVLRLEAIAGTTADRKATKKQSEQAAKVYATEGPKLEAQLEELEAKLRSMESDARLSANRLAAQVDALEKLRELVPEHVRDAYNSDKRALKSSLGRQIAEAECRAHELECCLNPDKYPSHGDYLGVLQRSCREAVSDTVSRGVIKRTHSTEWPSIRAEMEAELAKLRNELVSMREQFATELAELETKLDFYGKG